MFLGMLPDSRFEKRLMVLFRGRYWNASLLRVPDRRFRDRSRSVKLDDCWMLFGIEPTNALPTNVSDSRDGLTSLRVPYK